MRTSRRLRRESASSLSIITCLLSCFVRITFFSCFLNTAKMILAYRWYKKHKAEKAQAAQAAQTLVDPPDISSDAPIAAGETDAIKADQSRPFPPAVEEKTVEPTRQVVVPEESKEEKRRRRIYRWKLILALFPAGFLASADLTIVSTAVTIISSDFSMLFAFGT
jgi:hypothetical protein